MSDSGQDQTIPNQGNEKMNKKFSMPEVTFTAFVMSLNTSALFHMGEIADPATGKKQIDPILAKHSVDTLDMLQKKTIGNLDNEEKELIENLIYELKMRYVKKCGK
jgi:hypothetical protein